MTSTGSDFREDTRPVLRPPQVEEARAEVDRIESDLRQPAAIQARIQDKGEMQRQLHALKHRLETQAPKPYEGRQQDAAVRRLKELEDEIVQGMPTSAEMRRRGPGSVDKHRRWEKRNKQKVQEWKNIRLRLHAAGMLPEEPADASDVANIERLRPGPGASGEQDLSVAQIEPKTYQFGTNGSGESVVLTGDELDVLERIDPELLARVALMDPDQRRQLKEIVARQVYKAEHAEPAQQVSRPQTKQQTGKPRGRKGGEMATLRWEAKKLGINTFGLGKEEIKRRIEAARDAA